MDGTIAVGGVAVGGVVVSVEVMSLSRCSQGTSSVLISQMQKL